MPPLPPNDDKALCDELQRVLRQLSKAIVSQSPMLTWLTVQQMARASGSTPALALRRCLLEALEKLTEYNAEGANILRRHYVDGTEVHIIARELAQVEGTINKKQRQAIAQLATVLYSQEAAEREAKHRRIASRLPPATYVRLFGVTAQVQELVERLKIDGPPWVVAFEGIGGIGKTASADWVVRAQAITSRWDEIAWVTVQQPSFDAATFFEILYRQLLAVEGNAHPPAPERERQVRTALKTRPHLVVVDHLECAAKHDWLVALLVDLAAPSKFLLTTRCSLQHVQGLYAIRMSQLDLNNAIALLQWEAHVRNLPALAAASPEDFDSIYAITGGNALALRWVASHTQVHSLDTVLNSLHQATSKHAETLYAHIYHTVWEMLDEHARRVLLLMPATSETGADVEFFRSVSGMEPSALHDALDLLVTLSLVDSHGSLHARYYSIHNLTRTFLRRCESQH